MEKIDLGEINSQNTPSACGSGCVGKAVGWGEGCCDGGVLWCDPSLNESKELQRSQGGVARGELSLVASWLTVPQAACDKVLGVYGVGGVNWIGDVTVDSQVSLSTLSS